MRAAIHCTWTLLLLMAASTSAHAQQPQAGATISYSVFLRGLPVGTENARVTANPAGMTIQSDARLGSPLNVTLRSAELQYGADWTPVSFAADASFNGNDANIRTTFQNGTATTQGIDRGAPVTQTQPVTGRAVVLPSMVFSSYIALAKRLATDPPGTELRALIPLQFEFPIRVTAVVNEQTQVGTDVFPVRRYELLFNQPNGDLPVTVVASPEGDLIRFSIPSQLLEVIRSDVASPTSRTGVFSNPGDEAVIIPVTGFNLGATITRPSGAAPAKRPAVVLLGSAGVTERDGFLSGVPVLGQLAGALADAGFVAVRYDKRGYGQSGGRSESATLLDHVEDTRAVAKWLAERPDVDPRRIAVVGHGEGAMVALLAAAKDRRITAVVSVAGPSTTGAEQFLEQQQLLLEGSNVPQAEREKRMELQRQVQQAVLTGKGWESLPPTLRRDADTPWFQSLLAYDPAKVVDDVRQPLLIVHGEIDREIPVAHADRLATLARQKSNSKSIDIVIVRGVNHLLVPAVTGATSEYGTLTDRNVSKDVTKAVTDWLTRTLPASAR